MSVLNALPVACSPELLMLLYYVHKLLFLGEGVLSCFF